MDISCCSFGESMFVGLAVKGGSAAYIDRLRQTNELDWEPDTFVLAGTDPVLVSNIVERQLGSLLTVNRIKLATVKGTSNGLQAKYGVSYDTASTPDMTKGIQDPMLRFGPIPIPKSLEIDITATFVDGKKENTEIYAVCDSAIYSLFRVRQGAIDGNWSYGASGIAINNRTKKVLSFSNSRPVNNFAAAYNLAVDMPAVFAKKETTCEIVIVSPAAVWHGGAKPSASPFVFKKLKMSWT